MDESADNRTDAQVIDDAGTFTQPNDGLDPGINWGKVFRYCSESGIAAADLTDEQLQEFRWEDSEV